MKSFAPSPFPFVLSLLLALGAAGEAAAAIFTVTSNADTGAGTLRQAILDANGTVAIDEIRFSLAAGQRVITPLTPLPVMTTGIDVNGTSQSGYAGVPLVALSGATAGGIGLRCTVNFCTVRGLAVYGFATGVAMDGNFFLVKSNYIGLTAAGAGGSGNTGGGVSVGGDFGTLGGTLAADRNVISGNGGDGVVIGADSNNTTIYNNYIGTNVAGSAAIGNGGYAIRQFGTASSIGSNLAGSGNVISGNGRGISLEAAGSSDSSVRGNIIGLNAAGTAKIPNDASGIEVNSDGNTIGGATAGDRNVISGNANSGVAVGAGRTDILVQGNWIGTDGTGTAALGNGGVGITLGGHDVVVGGTAAGEGNVISGNLYGLDIGGDDNVLYGNRIGTNAAGTAAVANSQTGIRLYGDGNAIGGGAAGAANVISGNGTGIQVIGGSGNFIRGNRIGTNAAGTAAVGNGSYAIRVIGASGNFIGGTGAGEGNVMSGNGRGVAIDADAPGNTLQGNLIGLAADGLAPLGNLGNGLELNSSANVIGGPVAGAGNVIASNQYYGIFFQGGACSGNVIQGNNIGLAADDSTLRGNWYNLLFYGASGNVIGGGDPGEGNTIAGSLNAGAYVWFGTHNQFSGNSFFSNGGLGIELEPQGLAPNDALDTDTGANEQQNLPVLATAVEGSGQLAIQGVLKSETSSSYRIEYFSSSNCDPSGFGEGTHFLGASQVQTNASGVATISTNVAYAGGDSVVTATATSQDGDTSEFSPCVPINVAANAGALQFSQAQFLGYEEIGGVTILVSRTGGSSGSVTVHYATSDGTATAPADYTSTSGTLTFADGEVVKSFNVPLVLDGPEGNQQVNLTLSSPTGGAILGSQSTSHVLVFDYDTAFPGVFISDVTVLEGNSGTKNADFKVTLTPTDHTVTFKVRTSAGTATSGEDYDDQTVDLSFSAGEGPKTVSVPIHGDTVEEQLEAFYMQVSGAISPGGYAGNIGHGYILNDDGAGVCGDGTIGDGETCDDGNLTYALGDYCSATCVRFPCGIPTKVDGAAPKASDALFVLKAAVAASNCSKKVCDVNNSNSVTASDALAILKKAVGQVITLNCPA